MRAVIFSDMHFHLNPKKSYIDSYGFNSWYKIQESILRYIFDCAVSKDADFIIHNGDLFEEKFRINQKLYNQVWNLFYEFHLENPNIQLIFNTGNHDTISQTLSKSTTTLDTFSSFIEIVDSPTQFYDFTIIPYGFPIQEQDENKILFTHSKYEGLVHGETNYKFNQGDGSTALSSVRNYDIVFNGHIHHPQQIENIINIGSPMIDDWGTVDNMPHGFIYYDGEITFVKTEYPRFIKIKKLNEKLKNRIMSNNYDFFRIDISREELEDDIFKKYNVSPNIVKQRKREARIKKTESVDIIREYVEQSNTDLDKDKLIKIGGELCQ